MKVWLVQRSEPTPHDNAGDQRIMRMGILAQMLARAGHQVVWWTSTFDHHNRRHRYKKDMRLPVEAGYDIQYLHGCGYSRNISVARIMDNILVARRFSVLMEQESERPDVIVASIPTAELCLSAVKYARKHGVPVLLDVRDLWPDVFLDLVPNALKPAVHLLSVSMRRKLKSACMGATGIIGLTDAFVDWGVVHAGRSRHDYDRVFPMGYLERKRPATYMDEGRQFWHDFGVGNIRNELNVVFVGTLGTGFDFAPIIQAANLLKQKQLSIKFIICGSGENEHTIKTQAKGLDNVLFPGWVNADQIRALLELADVGLAPYIYRKDFLNSNPNKAAEYLSGGLVIALSLGKGALHDLLSQYECGFSYHNDPDILVHELECLLSNIKKRNKYKLNAHNTFKDYLNADVVYSNLISYLEYLVQGNIK